MIILPNIMLKCYDLTFIALFKKTIKLSHRQLVKSPPLFKTLSTDGYGFKSVRGNHKNYHWGLNMSSLAGQKKSNVETGSRKRLVIFGLLLKMSHIR